MGKVAAHESTSEEIAFDEKEPPTRRSNVNLVDYAREAEALLAQGLDVESAQMLRATISPSDPQDASSPSNAIGQEISLEQGVRLAASPEEIAWFPLSDGASAILCVLEGPISVRAALERADLSIDEGLEHIRTLLEIGLVVRL